MVIPSGPSARELPLFLIACETISGEKRNIEPSSGHFLFFKEFPLDNPGGRVSRMEDRRGEWFKKGSVGEDKRRVSRSTTSRLGISVRPGDLLGM